MPKNPNSCIAIERAAVAASRASNKQDPATVFSENQDCLKKVIASRTWTGETFTAFARTITSDLSFKELSAAAITLTALAPANLNSIVITATELVTSPQCGSGGGTGSCTPSAGTIVSDGVCSLGSDALSILGACKTEGTTVSGTGGTCSYSAPPSCTASAGTTVSGNTCSLGSDALTVLKACTTAGTSVTGIGGACSYSVPPSCTASAGTTVNGNTCSLGSDALTVLGACKTAGTSVTGTGGACSYSPAPSCTASAGTTVSGNRCSLGSDALTVLGACKTAGTSVTGTGGTCSYSPPPSCTASAGTTVSGNRCSLGSDALKVLDACTVGSTAGLKGVGGSCSVDQAPLLKDWGACIIGSTPGLSGAGGNCAISTSTSCGAGGALAPTDAPVIVLTGDCAAPAHVCPIGHVAKVAYTATNNPIISTVFDVLSQNFNQYVCMPCPPNTYVNNFVAGSPCEECNFKNKPNAYGSEGSCCGEDNCWFKAPDQDTTPTCQVNILGQCCLSLIIDSVTKKCCVFYDGTGSFINTCS